jgi:hypothetical protein
VCETPRESGGGCGTLATAQRTIQAYEALHMLHKGQLEGVTTGDVLAQNRVINQLFGVAASRELTTLLSHSQEFLQHNPLPTAYLPPSRRSRPMMWPCSHACEERKLKAGSSGGKGAPKNSRRCTRGSRGECSSSGSTLGRSQLRIGLPPDCDRSTRWAPS